MVVEAVREGAEDFMSRRRISAFVEDIIEDGVVKMVGPIATDVYYTTVVSRSKHTCTYAAERYCTARVVFLRACGRAPVFFRQVFLSREARCVKHMIHRLLIAPTGEDSTFLPLSEHRFHLE